MARILVIVSKDKPDLYEYLRRSYAHQDGVRVIMDRRLNRGGTEVRQMDGCSTERRRQPDIDLELIFRLEIASRAPQVRSALAFTFDKDWTARPYLGLRPQAAQLAWATVAP